MYKSKTVSILLAGSLLAGCFAFTGCSGNRQREAVKITEDTPWYSSEYRDILGTDSLSEDQYHYEDYLGKIGNEYVFKRNVFTQTEGRSFADGVPYYDVYDDSFIFYNPDTGIPREIDILDLAADSGLISDETLDLSIDDVSVTDDIRFSMQVMLGMYEGYVTYDITLDPVSGTFTDIEERGGESDFFSDYDIYMYWVTALAGGRKLEYGLVYYNDIMTLVLRSTDDNGRSFDCMIEDIYPETGVYDIFDPVYRNPSDALIRLKTYGEDQSRWIEIDFTDGTVTAVTDDMSYMDGIDPDNVCYSEEFGNIMIDNEEIIRIDPDAGTAESIFSFDWCNVNRSDIDNMIFIGMDDQRIFLFDQTPTVDFDYNYIYRNELLVLTKCDTNPNVGKTVLTVASLGEVSDAVSRAICSFNENSSDYFVRYVDDYNITSYGNIYADTGYIAALDPSVDMEMTYFLDEQSDADINDFYMDAGSELSNRIIVDMMSGEGPDILLDAIGHSELNNSEYLLDLSSYLPSDRSVYFDNIIDAAYTGDALYNMPLLFSISGIVTDRGNIQEGQTGFTFDQYEAFTDEVCNGRDPMAMSRLNFLSSVLATMDEDYYNGRNVDFGSDGFRRLAQYALDHVSDNPNRNTSPAAEYYEWSSVIDSIDMHIGEDKTIVGVPSVNGAGPAAVCTGSAAVYAGTAAPDGCWDFIETLLSEEIQTAMASDGFPVRVSAFETATEGYLDSYRAYYEYMQENAGDAMVGRLGIADTDSSVIPAYEEIIRSADRIYAYDPPVMRVIREEIQAYFAGDKTIDEVISLINNRAQTFYDERG